MKKSIFAVFSAFVLVISTAACGNSSHHEPYREIYERYNHMESYYAAATVRVFSDKSKSEYSVRQFYQKPDKYAFFVDSPETVAGSGYVAQNGQFAFKSGTGDSFDSQIAFPDSKNCMFICDFFEEYYKSEEASVAADNGLTEDKIVMQCYTSERNPNRFMQSLTVDAKTYLPLVLTTYNTQKEAVAEVEFHDFKRNAQIDQKIFE